MKNAYIIHGWGGNPKEKMLQWVAREFGKLGYAVTIPAMPNADGPEIQAWIEKLNQTVELTDETVLIGHSIGCQAVLRYLEQAPGAAKAAAVILIAPWMELDEETIKEEGPES